MVKVSEGTYPKPQNIAKNISMMKRLYNYERISTQFFSRTEMNKIVAETDLKKDRSSDDKLGNTKTDQTKNLADDQKEKIPDLEEDLCSICCTNVTEIVLESCGHTSFCLDCIRRTTRTTVDPINSKQKVFLNCPYCQCDVHMVLKIKRHIFDECKDEPKNNKKVDSLPAIQEKDDELNEFYGGQKLDVKKTRGTGINQGDFQVNLLKNNDQMDWYVVERVWGDYNDLDQLLVDENYRSEGLRLDVQILG